MNGRFNPAQVRALLFDLDGTLIETDDHYVLRLSRRLRPLLPASRADCAISLARRIIMASETPTNLLFAVFDRLAIDEAFRPLLTRLHRMRGEPDPSHVQIVAGAHATLDLLSNRFQLAIVTAREHHSAQAALQASGISSYFPTVITAGSTRRAKPHPAPVLAAAARLRLSPQACLMIGDTTVDIRSGSTAGAQTAGVLSGFGHREELSAAGADLILESVRELPAMLEVQAGS